jgi:hypothetical protein
LVGKERLELSRVTPLVPKTSASTNSATRPLYVLDVGKGVEFLPTPFSREVENSVKSVAVKTIWILYL